MPIIINGEIVPDSDPRAQAARQRSTGSAAPSGNARPASAPSPSSFRPQPAGGGGGPLDQLAAAIGIQGPGLMIDHRILVCMCVRARADGCGLHIVPAQRNKSTAPSPCLYLLNDMCIDIVYRHVYRNVLAETTHPPITTTTQPPPRSSGRPVAVTTSTIGTKGHGGHRDIPDRHERSWGHRDVAADFTPAIDGPAPPTSHRLVPRSVHVPSTSAAVGRKVVPLWSLAKTVPKKVVSSRSSAAMEPEPCSEHGSKWPFVDGKH